MTDEGRTRVVEPEYVFYVGDRIGTVGLWERRGPEFERPIVANTRGENVWFSSDPEQTNLGDGDPRRKPTQAFWEALYQIHSGADRIDIRDCEWYERQVIHSAINMLEQEDVPRDLGLLLEDSEVRVDGE